MIAAMLVSSLLAAQAANRAPEFRPRLNIRFQVPPPRLHQPQPEIVCGMVVVRTSPDDDPKILLPRRQTGAAIRRIEPHVCGAAQGK